MKYLVSTALMLLVFACAKQPVSKMRSQEGASRAYRKQANEKFVRGEQLYKKYCSSCHGIFGDGKTDVPNFSTNALHNYNAAFIRGDRENHAFAAGINEESFEEILFFLSNRETATPNKQGG